MAFNGTMFISRYIKFRQLFQVLLEEKIARKLESVLWLKGIILRLA
jgi:hypothetical protein